MQPQLPIPTDNIYKFACLFGLALIVSSIFSFVTLYASFLEQKVKYFGAIIPLEAKAERSKVEQDLLALNKKLVEVTSSNEQAANGAAGAVFAIGVALSFFGALRWHRLIQLRDDRLAELQVRKLELEVAQLEWTGESLRRSPDHDDG